MVPDWKLERYLTGELPASEMRELRDLEATDEVFAGRVRMFREDNLAILRRMPFESLEAKLGAREVAANGANGAVGAGGKTAANFKLVKFAAAAVLVFAFVMVAVFMSGTADGILAGGEEEISVCTNDGTVDGALVGGASGIPCPRVCRRNLRTDLAILHLGGTR